MVRTVFELTRTQKIVLRAVKKISLRRGHATGREIKKECVDPGTDECIAKASMYKAIHALKEADFLREEKLKVPGRKSTIKFYVLNYASLGDSGLTEEI